jgi:cytidyltransferase-like protein
MSKIVLVTGGFDPIHSGHVEYLRAAKQFGDVLVVGLNSDEWLQRKKGRAFMPWAERYAVVSKIKYVDQTTYWDDSDGSAIKLIEDYKKQYPNDEIIFANGGDRTAQNIPEMVCKDVTFKFGVGGQNKANSSSWILEEWKAPKTERPWGYYRVLHDVAGTKVKELTINPGQKLSMQRHKHRAEHWHVTEGMCQVDSQMDGGYYLPPRTLSKHMTLDIPAGQWHQLTNPYNDPCKLVEIQYGPVCEEDDIERR